LESLKDFLNYHKEMNTDNAPIENEKNIIEATVLYANVR